MARRPRLSEILPAYVPPLVRDKPTLLAEIDRAWNELDGLVRGLDDGQLNRVVPGLGEGAEAWAVKDVLAHIAAWKRNAAAIARRQASHRKPVVNAFPGRVLGFKTDDFNAEVIARWQAQPAAAAVSEHRAAHADLLDALEAVPAARLVRRGRSVLWLTPGLGHPRVHLVDLRRALEPSA